MASTRLGPLPRRWGGKRAGPWLRREGSPQTRAGRVVLPLARAAAVSTGLILHTAIASTWLGIRAGLPGLRQGWSPYPYPYPLALLLALAQLNP